MKAGYQAVYDADLKGYFDTIPHDRLLAGIRQRIADVTKIAAEAFPQSSQFVYPGKIVFAV